MYKNVECLNENIITSLAIIVFGKYKKYNRLNIVVQNAYLLKLL